jgi:hypothetical protein
MSRFVLLVTGSRALADLREGERWARGILRSIIDAAALRHREVMVLAGGASGPDRWATQECSRWVEYLPDGRRRSSFEPERRWSAEPVHPHRRNEAMVRAVVRARDAGWAVQVIALRAQWSRTDGTGHCARCARRAGLVVEVHEINAPPWLRGVSG